MLPRLAEKQSCFLAIAAGMLNVMSLLRACLMSEEPGCVCSEEWQL